MVKLEESMPAGASLKQNGNIPKTKISMIFEYTKCLVWPPFALIRPCTLAGMDFTRLTPNTLQSLAKSTSTPKKETKEFLQTLQV